MNNLEQIKAAAQRDANREGRPMVIYNLNPHSPLYVVRSYKPGCEAHFDFVAKIEPQDVALQS